MASELHDAAHRRDGFVERLIPMVPTVGVARWSDASPTAGQYADVKALFLALDRLPAAEDGIPLSPAAQHLFIGWHDENAAIIEHADGLAAGFFAKLPAHVARVALILHALWNVDDALAPVRVDRMEDAIELGEFVRAHIKRFLALLHAAAPDQSAGLQRRILRITRSVVLREKSEWVLRSAILVGVRPAPVREVSAALDALHERGVIERRLVPTATKPAEEWRLVECEHPESLKNNTSNYSQYSPAPDETPTLWDTAEDASILLTPRDTDVSNIAEIDVAHRQKSEQHPDVEPNSDAPASEIDVAHVCVLRGEQDRSDDGATSDPAWMLTPDDPAPVGCPTPERCPRLGGCAVYRQTGRCGYDRSEVAP